MAELRRTATAHCEAALNFDAALAKMLAVATSLAEEVIPLTLAAGRVLARPIIAQRDSPPVDVSAMDGYAVADPESAMGTFHVNGEARPGMPIAAVMQNGCAIRVFTGAPIPEGASHIVVQEAATVYGKKIVFSPADATSRHIRRKGSDFRVGQNLLAAGTLLDQRTLVAAAASGSTEVSVTRKPRVAILVTGDEVHLVGNLPPSSLAIPDSISLPVSALAVRWGADVITPSSATDDPVKIAAALRDAIHNADVVIMTGGASVGDYDHCTSVVREAGGRLQFAKVAMKPGKPIWHAMIGKTHVLGLPGNPTAALTTARLFLAPLLCALSGRRATDALRWQQTGWAEDMQATDTRERFLCGSWNGETVTLIHGQSASSQHKLALANVLVRIPVNGHDCAGDAAVILDF